MTRGRTRRAGFEESEVRRVGEVVAVRPSYEGGSIVNLMASVVAAGGGESPYPVLEGLDVHSLRAARHLILIVVDGLGYQHLCSGHAPVMSRHLRGSMTSVFPPTTATAVTTYLTGLAPQQHGLTGWYVHFRELGGVARVLPFTTRLGAVPLESLGVEPTAFFAHTAVFDRLERKSYSVSPARIAHSAFNRAHSGRAQIRPYTGLDGFVSAIRGIATGSEGPSFVYAYWPELDALAHAEGIGSKSVAAHLDELDAAFGTLLDDLQGTDSLVILTADHGFVDIAPERLLDLADHPRLGSTLSLPLCGEPRTAFCYVSPGREADFLAYVESELADCALCVPSADLVAGGYFGPGEAHPGLLDRVGHYTLLMREGYAIRQRLPGEARPPLVGLHGGGSSAELLVPLVVAEV